MKKSALIAGSLLVVCSSAAMAQKVALLQTIEIPSTGFHLVVASVQSPAPVVYRLDNSPDALIVRLPGGEMVLPFDDAAAMLRMSGRLRGAVGAIHVTMENSEMSGPVSIWLLRNDTPASPVK